jgi:hypothetical protein
MSNSDKMSELIKKMSLFDTTQFDAFVLSRNNYKLYCDWLGDVDDPAMFLTFRGRPIFVNHVQERTIFPGVAVVKWVQG